MRKETDYLKQDMSMQWNTLAVSSRSVGTRGCKTLCAALLAALMIVPNAFSQAESTPASKTWSAASEKGGRLYSMSFEGGKLSDLKRVWTNVFTNDNFLINFPGKSVDLPAFQLRDMTLTELARSIAFLSQGTIVVEVVERNERMPGNIWRVAHPSVAALSQSIKMRAVSAPRLFATGETLERFIAEVKLAQRKMFEALYELKKEENSIPVMGTQILPLDGQRVFVLIGTEEGVSGLESLIKAAEQSASEPAKESKSGK